MKFLSKRFLYFLSCYLVIMIINTACVSFRDSDKKVFRKFKDTSVVPIIDYVNYKGKKVRYISDKKIDSKKSTLVFIHGAPGSAGNYFGYLKDKELGEKANLITVDRLGYGYSDYGNSETSIDIQAESIFTIVKKHQLQKLILIGWSYGVPIAAKMAYKFPEVKHSLLVAGAVSPEDEKFFGIAKMARWKLTKWMVPKALKIADDEKMEHVAELTIMLDEWKQIKSPITYYHGTEDNIVPYKNMDFIKTKVNDNLLKAVTLKDMNHFILSKKYELIKKELLDILDKI